MFGKKNDAPAQPAPLRAEPESDKAGQKGTPSIRCTVIAEHTVITGDVVVKGDCQVFGRAQGTVIVTEGVLQVMKGGCVDGDIRSPTVVIDGQVTGVCEATTVEILDHGAFNGDLRVAHLSITPGGVFLGQSQRMNGDITLPTPVVDIGSHPSPSTRKKVIELGGQS